MSARLPVPGNDNNTWGDVLNTFLTVEHNADGTIKTLAVSKGGTGAVSSGDALINLGAVSVADSRLTNARIPLPHSSSHVVGGTDVITPSDINGVAKNELFFNVEDFGATGDGTTNDTAAVQAAINAAGSGTVWFPVGTYLVSSALVVTNTGCTLLGAGWRSIIKKINGGTNDIISTGNATSNVFFCRIAHLTLDGNKANCGSGHNLNLRSAHTWVIEHCHIVNAADKGISLNGDSPSALALNNWIRFNRIEDSRNQCIHSNAYAPNNHIISNIIGGTDDWACVELSNIEQMVTGNHIHGSHGYGIHANLGSDDSIISNNFVESSGGSGIFIESGVVGVVLSSNNLFNNALVSTGGGITVGGNYCSVTANRCVDRQATKTQDFGVWLTGTSNGCVATANISRVADHIGAGILDQGTGNSVATNIV